MLRTSPALKRVIAVLYWTAAWAVVLPHAHHADRTPSLHSDPADGAGTGRRLAWSGGKRGAIGAGQLTAGRKGTVRPAASDFEHCSTDRRPRSRHGDGTQAVASRTDEPLAEVRVGGECWCQAAVKRAAPQRACQTRLVAEPVGFLLLPATCVRCLRALRSLLPRAPPFSAA